MKADTPRRFSTPTFISHVFVRVTDTCHDDGFVVICDDRLFNTHVTFAVSRFHQKEHGFLALNLI